MIYLRARYYDPKIGRFTSHDIEEGGVSNPLDMNRYVYCRNNPVKYVDPSGESVVIAGVVITGELIALIGTGIAILGYIANKAFVNAFTSAVNSGNSVKDGITYAKGKAKDPTPPSKLKMEIRLKPRILILTNLKRKKMVHMNIKKQDGNLKRIIQGMAEIIGMHRLMENQVIISM